MDGAAGVGGCSNEELYRAGVVLVHDPHLLGHAMYFVMETFQIWNLASVGHGRCSIIQGAASTWSGRSNGRVHESRRDPRKDEYGKISRRYRRHNWKDCHLERFWWRWSLEMGIPSTLPHPKAVKRQYFNSDHLRSSDGGSGELSVDDLARFRAKRILSSDPLVNPNNYEVVVIYRGMRRLAFFGSAHEAVWAHVKNIGDQALFLGDNHSVSVSTMEFPECQSNCIYYTDQNHNRNPPYAYHGVDDDSGVFNLEDGSFHSHYVPDPSEKHILLPPIWVDEEETRVPTGTQNSTSRLCTPTLSTPMPLKTPSHSTGRLGSARFNLRDVTNDVGLGRRATRKLKMKRPSGRPQGKIELTVAVREPSHREPEPYYAPPYGVLPNSSRDYVAMPAYGNSYALPRPNPYYSVRSAGAWAGCPTGLRPGFVRTAEGREEEQVWREGVGLVVGAVAGFLGGLSIADGVDYVEDKIVDDVAEKVEDDLLILLYLCGFGLCMRACFVIFFVYY
ncbi:hypothetical protein Acr_18g0006230 [Actinidia rufa]|uniref:KIB1-4 beta-propeller domain-containing protein n=1 Tax=Actinidia rufa TaxID=165716 RepID=A0A7J0G6N7_9ERIC|nr:hypothetical protein Acr_18g0006230 [Actinidia rufa]